MSFSKWLKYSVKSSLPKPILFQLSPKFVSAYARSVTWLVTSRHYAAPIDPFQLIDINPKKINTKVVGESKSQFRHSDVVSEVVGGNWDKKLLHFDDYDMYNAFVDRFINEVNWEDTHFYQDRLNIITSGEPRWGCNTVEQFESRLYQIDSIYERIQSEGYEKQREIRRTEQNYPGSRDIHRFWPPALHEVTINIDRDGQPILHDGRHRLFIAKIQGIDSIPVRIKTRHLLWQNKRDQVYSMKNSDNYTHPDLQF